MFYIDNEMNMQTPTVEMVAIIRIMKGASKNIFGHLEGLAMIDSQERENCG